LSLEHFNPSPLLAWYDKNKRALPWRDTSEPYPIWISEIMLQQTQVTTVLPRYAAWFETFPSINALAAADEDQVMQAWEGLGYYRRARYAHRAAKKIMREHGGVFPCAFKDILALSGIGRSTAGAIASFAFGDSYPVLDGNVQRVLHRCVAPSSNKAQWQQAESMIEASSSPALWNQAMMELGATCCLRSKPLCLHCPLQKQCNNAFETESLCPIKKNTITVIDLHWQVQLYYRKEGTEIWLSRRPNDGIWGGLWSPPIHESHQPNNKPPSLIHTLTHRRLHLYGIHMPASPPTDQGQWFSFAKLPALPTGIKRLFTLMIDD